MTREEAIGRIQEHIHIHSKKEPFTPYLDEAFDMAIEALTENESLAKSVIEASELLRKNRPHGEWKKDGFFAICSECGHELQYYEYVVSKLNFCPNCGADMRPKEDEANENHN